jgi:hypothetical protein
VTCTEGHGRDPDQYAGFTWISWSSFLLGLVESYGYGWYFTLIWVPLYNVFNAGAMR